MGMKRDHDSMQASGTRDELVTELRKMATGWDHLAKPANASEATKGAETLEGGASSVRVGHTTYTVEPGDR